MRKSIRPLTHILSYKHLYYKINTLLPVEIEELVFKYLTRNELSWFVLDIRLLLIFKNPIVSIYRPILTTEIKIFRNKQEHSNSVYNFRFKNWEDIDYKHNMRIPCFLSTNSLKKIKYKHVIKSKEHPISVTPFTSFINNEKFVDIDIHDDFIGESKKSPASRIRKKENKKKEKIITKKFKIERNIISKRKKDIVDIYDNNCYDQVVVDNIRVFHGFYEILDALTGYFKEIAIFRYYSGTRYSDYYTLSNKKFCYIVFTCFITTLLTQIMKRTMYIIYEIYSS